MATFKCRTCGNLHGAKVENCGICGSADVALLPETPATLPPPPIPGIDPEQTEEITDALIECLSNAAAFFRAGAEWFRANTDTKRDPWPASPPGPTVVEGPKK
jgi:hypothetical protein